MKLLVLGCGSIGARHARNATPLAKVGLFDSDPAKATGLANSTGAERFDSLEAALDWAPTAAVVATPNDLHLEHARRCVEAGAHVLIEKPIAPDLESVADFLDRAESLGRRVYVGCNMRFHEGPARLRAALPRIGQPHFARAHFGNYLPNMRPGVDYRTLYCARRATGGGVILDGIHELDYIAWLLGPVTEVRCAAGRLSDLDLDVEDYAAITLRHASGARSEIHLDYLQQAKRRGCEIVGSEGTLVWNSEGKTPEACTVRLYERGRGAWGILSEVPDLDGNQAYVAMLNAFLAALDGAEPAASNLLTGRAAMNDLSVALAALEAAAHGESRAVRWAA